MMGPELTDSMRKQAERFGAELVPDDVTAVDLAAVPKVATGLIAGRTWPGRSSSRPDCGTGNWGYSVSGSGPGTACPGVPVETHLMRDGSAPLDARRTLGFWLG